MFLFYNRLKKLLNWTLSCFKFKFSWQSKAINFLWRREYWRSKWYRNEWRSGRSV